MNAGHTLTVYWYDAGIFDLLLGKLLIVYLGPKIVILDHKRAFSIAKNLVDILPWNLRCCIRIEMDIKLGMGCWQWRWRSDTNELLSSVVHNVLIKWMGNKNLRCVMKLEMCCSLTISLHSTLTFCHVYYAIQHNSMIQWYRRERGSRRFFLLFHVFRWKLFWRDRKNCRRTYSHRVVHYRSYRKGIFRLCHIQLIKKRNIIFLSKVADMCKRMTRYIQIVSF